MKQLTKRERVLVYILICFCVFAFGVFLLVLPAVEPYHANAEELDAAQMSKLTTEMTIANIPSLQTNLEKMRTDIAEKSAPLYAPLFNEEIDRTVYENIHRYGFAITSMSITAPVHTPFPLFAGVIVDPQAPTETAPAEADADTTHLSISTVTLNLEGENGFGDFVGLVDSVSRQTALRVNAFSSGTKMTDENGKSTELYTLTLELVQFDPEVPEVPPVPQETPAE